jgi:hypothetical protein
MLKFVPIIPLLQMKPFTILFLICILLTVFVGCNKTVTNSSTYFGGKIINPKSDHVILYAMDKAIDTFSINAENKFGGILDSIQEGLYYFVHGNENQFLYIEPKDSIMLSLNTWDFDESLVFSGIGAERNNVLIDCFLQFEKDEKIFYRYNSLYPKSFKAKVDSIISLRVNTHEAYVKRHPSETENFKKVLKIALTYPVYARIESYPISHAKKMKLERFPTLPLSFYEYRKDIDIGIDALMYYKPYSKYITNYLYNATYTKGHSPMQNNFSSNFTVDLLNTIAAKVNSKTFKNAILKQTVISHFYKKSTCDINTQEFDVFLALSSNDEDKDLVKKLLIDNQIIHKNHEIGNFYIHDYTNASYALQDVIQGKNTFLFFWSSKYVSKPYVRARSNYLSNKYPNVQFLTLKIDGNSTDQIKNLDIKKQFFIDRNSSANTFLTSQMTRSILINKNGILTNGFASISSRNIYTQLDRLNNN